MTSLSGSRTHIIRYADHRTRAVHVGTLQDGQVGPVEGVDSFADLLGLPLDQIRLLVEQSAEEQSAQSVADVLPTPTC